MADINKKIITTFETNAKEAAQDVDKLLKKTDELADSTDKVSQSNKEAKKSSSEFFDVLDNFLGGAISQVKSFRDQIVTIGSGVKDWAVQTKIGATAQKALNAGFGLGTKAAKLFKVALASTGIGLIIVAVGTLVEYFSNFEGGVKAVQKALNVFNGVLGQVTASIEKLFSGDWTGFKEGILGVVDAGLDAAKATDAQFESQRKLNELQEKNITQNAELSAELERNLKVLEDGTATYEQRVEALQNVEIAETKIIENKKLETEVILDNLKAQLALENNYQARRDLAIQIAEVEADLIKTQSELSLKSGEAAKKIRELNIQRAAEAEAAAQKQRELDQSFLDNQTKLQQDITLLQIEEGQKREEKKLEFDLESQRRDIERSSFSEEQKAALLLQIEEKYQLDKAALIQKYQDEQDAKVKEAEQKRIDDQLAARLEADAILEDIRLNQITNVYDRAQEELRIEFEKNRAILESAGATSEELSRLDADYAEQSKLIAKDRTDYEKELDLAVHNAKIGLATQAIGAIGSLLNEGSKAQKAFAVSEAIISTYGAISNTLKTAALNPASILFPGFPYIQAGIMAVQGFANVRKILSVQPGSSSAPSPSSPTASSSSAPILPQLTQGTAVQSNQIGTVVANQLSNKPIKTYVSLKDLNSANELDRLSRNAGRL